MRFFEAGAARIPYSVVRGNSRAYTHLRFRPDLTLEVVLPRGKAADPEEAIRSQLGWVKREYERMSRTRRVLGRDEVLFDGAYLRLVFEESSEDRLAPHIEQGVVAVRTKDRRRGRELVRRWFLKESSAYAVRKCGELAPRLGVTPSRVDVREISKWGYCTRAGRLSFSWQLAALPERLREYVVVHELAHLAEFNHSPKFTRKVASLVPDFRRREKELDLILPYDRKELS
ncbi:MAG: DUF45 domain-containing protein [Thaumarchaeota archaeon]|nr:DUF45 domain-containing protein [Nitrososphaerota archaeon]